MPRYDGNESWAETPCELWQIERNKTLSAQVGGFRLTIETWSADNGTVLFIIRRPEHDAVIVSGREADTRRAMAAAERIASRLRGSCHLFRRPAILVTDVEITGTENTGS